jgi:apolipoprotein D and lipocalin family protein
MSFLNHVQKPNKRLIKIALLGVFVAGILSSSAAYAEPKPLVAVEKVELDKYLGVWYEVARKPMYFERKCIYDITATYTLNENGNIVVDNKCYDLEGNLQRSVGEAFVSNAPFNSKLRVSFLPEGVRWIPVGRGDYWILKLDDDYQTVLVGEPKRKYLWILSRTPQLKKEQIHEYLNYAKSQGYNVSDVIYPEHRP